MMNRSASTPAAIEGSEISIAGQDIRPAGLPRPLRETQEVVFPISVKKRGKSTIISEYNPKEYKFRDYSFLDSGSEIEGPILWGFSSDPLHRDSISVGGAGRTHSHSGQHVQVSGICFLEIIKGYIGSPVLTHPQNDLLA